MPKGVYVRQVAPLADRFWQRVDKRGADECWPWLGAQTRNGYGRFYDGARATPAHRFAYEMVHGPIHAGLQMDHLCRNTICVNPSHVEPVTQKENNRRGYSFAGCNWRKTHCDHGHPLDGRQGPGGIWRKCLTCHRAYQKRYLAKRAA